MAGQVSITIGTPAFDGAGERRLVDHPELEPHRAGADGHRLVGELPGRAGPPEHVHHVDRERDVGQRRVALLAVHHRGVRVHRDDALPALLQQPGDGVGGAAGLAGQPDHGPGRAVVEHEAHGFGVLPGRVHGIHGRRSTRRPAARGFGRSATGRGRAPGSLLPCPPRPSSPASRSCWTRRWARSAGSAGRARTGWPTPSAPRSPPGSTWPCRPAPAPGSRWPTWCRRSTTRWPPAAPW